MTKLLILPPKQKAVSTPKTFMVDVKFSLTKKELISLVIAIIEALFPHSSKKKPGIPGDNLWIELINVHDGTGAFVLTWTEAELHDLMVSFLIWNDPFDKDQAYQFFGDTEGDERMSIQKTAIKPLKDFLIKTYGLKVEKYVKYLNALQKKNDQQDRNQEELKVQQAIALVKENGYQVIPSKT